MLARLHGAVRSLTPVRQEPVGPESVAAAEDGVGQPPLPLPSAWTRERPRTVPRGRTRCSSTGSGGAGAGGLHPRARGTDVHDMFLEGRSAHVEAVLLDVDGGPRTSR